jgi:hypothetical protein
MIYQASRHKHIAVNPNQPRSESVWIRYRKVVGALVVGGEGSPVDAFDDCAPLSLSSFVSPSPLVWFLSTHSNSSYTSPSTYSTRSCCAGS